MSEYDDEAPPRRTGDLYEPEEMILKPSKLNFRRRMKSEAVIRRNIWFYRDRTGLPRGPMTIDTVKKCWIGGIIDEHTLVWGNGLGDWVPLRNIRGMGHVLNDPRTRFLKWITQKVAFPRAEVRANRDRLYEEGKAASPVMKSREEVAAWKAAREERLSSGEDNLMLSMSLALPTPGRAAERIGAAVEFVRGKMKMGGKKARAEEEENGGLRRA